MDNVLQNTQPSASILSTQVQKTSNHKRPINYLKILFIIYVWLFVDTSCYSTKVEVPGQHLGLNSLLPLCGSWEGNSA